MENNNKKQVKEGIFDAADRFVTKFFDGLSNGAANSIIKKAEQAKLPSRAIKAMKDMEDRAEELRRIAKELSK
jgi:hypothetical protein